MIEIGEHAKQILFNTYARYISIRTHPSYDVPPIHYWYRNVIEALKLVDYNVVNEGEYYAELEKSLGKVKYSVISLNYGKLVVVTDFVFNINTIQQYIDRADLATRGVDVSKRPLFNSLASKPIKSQKIGKGIVCIQYADGSIRLTWQSNKKPLNSQFDKIEKKFYSYKDGVYAIGVKDGVRFRFYPNDTTQRIDERRKMSLRLTESQFKKLITECVMNIIKKVI